MYAERKIIIQAALPLLECCGLTRSAQMPDYTVGILEEDGNTPLATGSLVGDMLQMIVVLSSHQGEYLTAKVITHLLRVAAQKAFITYICSPRLKIRLFQAAWIPHRPLGTR